MSGQAKSLPEFWAPKPRSLTFWLLLFLNALAFITTFVGTFDLARAKLLENRSGAETVVAFFVIVALLLIVQLVLMWAVKTFYSRQVPIVPRLMVFLIYLVCLLITAGFGFGFWWKLFYGNQETLASARASVEVTERDLRLASGRLDSLRSTLQNLQQYSTKQAENEVKYGNTCGRSNADEGPRQRKRNDDANRFSGIVAYVDGKQATFEKQIAEINKDLEMLVRNDSSTIDPATSTSTPFIERLNSKQNLAIQNFNNFTTDPVLDGYKSDLKDRAGKTEFTEGRVRFSCPDAQLSSTLNTVVKAIDELPKLEFRGISISQGSQAVAAALGRLFNTASSFVVDCHFYLKPCDLPPSASEIRNQIRTGSVAKTRNVREVDAGIDRNEIVPLTLGFVVDIAILGIGYFRYRRDIVPVNTDQFIVLLDRTFRTVFDRLPTTSERLLPIKAAGFDHWSGHYAAIPIDFSDYRSISGSGKAIPVWARRGEGQKQASESGRSGTENRNPTFSESQYLDNVFIAFSDKGLAKPRSFWGRFVMSDEKAKSLVVRQNSIFANTPTFKIYKFYPNAWNVVMMHFMTASTDTDSSRRDEQGGGSRGDQEGSGRTDRFPKGFGYEI